MVKWGMMAKFREPQYRINHGCSSLQKNPGNSFFFAGDVAPVTEWLCTPTNYDIMRGVRNYGLDQHPADNHGYSLAIGERGRSHYDPSSSRGID